MTDEYLNALINQEIEFSDNLSRKYNYPDNITHLLYLIIPAFIIKYGNNHKGTIEKCFSEVPIVIDDRQDQMYQAYYFSSPKYENGEVITTKGIVLKNYKNISLIQLLDNLVHEYNHAVNSIQNEIEITDYVKVRTGISYNYFDKKTLTFIKKSSDITVEEVINTKQTESIIDIIKDFNNHNIENSTIISTLYSISHIVGDGYKSRSYYLESVVCQKLMDNKTFISTFEKLRFDGYVEDLYHFFDNIMGKDGSFLELADILNKTLELTKQLSNTKFFKNSKINKIKDLTRRGMEIVEIFNNNTIYK